MNQEVQTRSEILKYAELALRKKSLDVEGQRHSGDLENQMEEIAARLNMHPDQILDQAARILFEKHD
jgi:predicted DNA-binding ribbon-helix-helix protein